MAVLYFGEIRQGDKLVDSIAVYGNDHNETIDHVLDRRPLKRGEKLTLVDFVGRTVAIASR